MIYKKQLITDHDPENGVYGDCYRTAVACILDIEDVSVVPHNWENQKVLMDKWLVSKGYRRILMTIDGSASVSDALETANNGSHGMMYILAGASSIGVNHAVVCQNDKFLWDPSHSDEFLCGPQDNGYWLVEIIVREL